MQIASTQRSEKPLKDVLRSLFQRTLARLSLDRVMADRVTCQDAVLAVGDERVDLSRYRRILVVAIGKVAFPMVDALAALLAPHPLEGIAVGLGDATSAHPGIARFIGGHPYPDTASFRAGDAVVDLVRDLTRDDVVLYLLSGGGSAMCEKPLLPDIPSADYKAFYALLVTSGLGIVEVNVLRKHLSAVKGGRLAELAHPARQVTLYVSDTPSANPSSVASGPTMPDESSVGECLDIVRAAGLVTRLPPSIRRALDKRRIPETPKSGAECFRSSSWHRLLGSEEAVAAMIDEARREEWIAEADLNVDDDCPLDQAVDHLLTRLERLRQDHPGHTVAIVNGGEYSCPVTGHGLGGRNQAFVLACVPRIRDRHVAVLSAGTDGLDGNSPAAGAIADGTTLTRAQAAGLDPLTSARRADSYGFFASLGDALLIGPTGNNVRDLRILVAW